MCEQTPNILQHIALFLTQQQHKTLVLNLIIFRMNNVKALTFNLRKTGC